MQSPPNLFDRKAIVRNRIRAAMAPALFLQERMADETHERLNEVNRTFTSPAIVTGWPCVWENRYPNARIVPDTDLLDLEPCAHDLVIHSLSLHWANDPVGQLVQCNRALKPDGLMIATMFGGQTLQELRRCLAQAESNISGGISPRIAPMGEIRDLGGLLQRAGFALPVADSAALTVSYPDAFSLMRDLRAMGETNAMNSRLRHSTSRKVLLEASRLYTETFADTDGRIPATFEIVTLTGWAPAKGQPQPLRPGSAQQRLADALGTTESSLNNLGENRRKPTGPAD